MIILSLSSSSYHRTTTSSWLRHGRCCHDVLKMTLKRDTWQVLLHGVVALTLYWVIQYRWQVTTLSLKSALFLQHLIMINFWAFLWPCLTQDKKGFPFAWRGSEPADREKQWNLHPVLMITGSLIFWLWLQTQCLLCTQFYWQLSSQHCLCDIKEEQWML